MIREKNIKKKIIYNRYFHINYTFLLFFYWKYKNHKFI